MNDENQEIWAFLHRHLHSVYSQDSATYRETTAADLSLYEWFVTPHRQDGLDFHFFMIDHGWAGTDLDFRYDLLEPRLQRYGDTVIISYTFMLSIATDSGIIHRSHNESRVLIWHEESWQVVHVHKSPAWQAPRDPTPE